MDETAHGLGNKGMYNLLGRNFSADWTLLRNERDANRGLLVDPVFQAILREGAEEIQNRTGPTDEHPPANK